MNSFSSPLGRVPRCPGRILARRDFLKRALLGAGLAAAGSPGALARVAAEAGEAGGAGGAGGAPRAPTVIGMCRRYDYREVRRALDGMFDRLGGLGGVVRRRRVVVKVNLVNTSQADVHGVPLGLTVVVHPVVAMALGNLLVGAGAREVVYCDQLPFRGSEAEAFAGYGYRLDEFNGLMKGRARFENTRNRGGYRDYATVKVPGGELATAWEVNRTYADAEVLVSVAKLKSHVSGGITGGLKNLFGIPPSSLYGDDLGEEPDEGATGYRSQTMHDCVRRPRTSVGTFTGRSVEGDHGHNVPRFIVDLAAAFPIALTVIDGISTIQSAEGWWNGSMVSVTRPGLLIAGLNPVNTDAVAAAVMGFEPDALDRTWPFVNGTNHLALARRRGLGENRLSRLEILGTPLSEARFHYEPTYRRKGA